MCSAAVRPCVAMAMRPQQAATGAAAAAAAFLVSNDAGAFEAVSAPCLDA